MPGHYVFITWLRSFVTSHNSSHLIAKHHNVHVYRIQGFVSAVMDVDYSPTGQEFVAGSYDRTVRIFNSTSGGSRDVYFAERMQRVFAVKFSVDASYVFSGSDDMNLRVWKAGALLFNLWSIPFN